MSIQNALASVAVKDLKGAAKWYARLLGRPADSEAMAEVLEWKFPRGGWLQVYELAERAGACSLTLAVTDLEAELVRLEGMNIDTRNVSSGPKVKVVMIADPDGNHIAISQALDPALGA